MCICLQRLKAEKAEITRFLQKPKIQQAPKVSRYRTIILFKMFVIQVRLSLYKLFCS